MGGDTRWHGDKGPGGDSGRGDRRGPPAGPSSPVAAPGSLLRGPERGRTPRPAQVEARGGPAQVGRRPAGQLRRGLRLGLAGVRDAVFGFSSSRRACRSATGGGVRRRRRGSFKSASSFSRRSRSMIGSRFASMVSQAVVARPVAGSLRGLPLTRSRRWRRSRPVMAALVTTARALAPAEGSSQAPPNRRRQRECPRPLALRLALEGPSEGGRPRAPLNAQFSTGGHRAVFSRR